MLGAGLLALLIPMQAPAEGAAPAARKMLVMALEAAAGVNAGVVAALSAHVDAEARRVDGYRVVTVKDVEQMVSAEMARQLMGCAESSCLAELSGALDVDEVLYGTVARLGARDWVLSLHRLDARRAAALGSESERVSPEDTDAMLDTSAVLLQRLFPDHYELPEARARGVAVGPLVGLMVLAGGAVHYAAFTAVSLSMVATSAVGLVLALPFTVLGVLTFCASPMLGAWLQAWVMDLVGRRQGSFRQAGLVGTALLAVAAILDAPLLMLVVPCSYVVGFVGGVVYGIALSGLYQDRFYGAFATGTCATSLGLLCAAQGTVLALAPLVVAMGLGIPAVQTFLLLRGAVPRPPGEESSVPRLYGRTEQPAGWTALLPRAVVGGDVEAAPEAEE